MSLPVRISDAVPLVVDLSEEARLLVPLAALDLVLDTELDLAQKLALDNLSHNLIVNLC